jgi:hypothetical protein
MVNRTMNTLDVHIIILSFCQFKPSKSQYGRTVLQKSSFEKSQIGFSVTGPYFIVAVMVHQHQNVRLSVLMGKQHI